MGRLATADRTDPRPLAFEPGLGCGFPLAASRAASGVCGCAVLCGVHIGSPAAPVPLRVACLGMSVSGRYAALP